MHLIDIHRRGKRRTERTIPNPSPVTPGVLFLCADEAGGIRQAGRAGAVGVSLVYGSAIGADNIVFVRAAFVAACGKDLPHAALQALHGQILLVPEIEFTHHADALGVGGPDPEHIAGFSTADRAVTA